MTLAVTYKAFHLPPDPAPYIEWCGCNNLTMCIPSLMIFMLTTATLTKQAVCKHCAAYMAALAPGSSRFGGHG
jgi:hypothetical protein